MIDLKTLRSLVKLMVESELTEVDLQDGEEKVKLRRGPNGQVQTVMPAMSPMPTAPTASSPAPAASGDAKKGEAAAADKADDGLKPIASPMVGSFYAAPSPDAAPFVKVGDTVDAETVVCVIEAMKVFNEIKAEMRGTIRKVLIENGQPVEFGQPLFMVDPA